MITVFPLCSNRKFARVMHHADINTNGIINRHEMNQFLFPEKEAQIQVLVCCLEIIVPLSMYVVTFMTVLSSVEIT